MKAGQIAQKFVVGGGMLLGTGTSPNGHSWKDPDKSLGGMFRGSVGSHTTGGRQGSTDLSAWAGPLAQPPWAPDRGSKAGGCHGDPSPQGHPGPGLTSQQVESGCGHVPTETARRTCQQGNLDLT